MLVDFNREKLINAIIYFATNTKFCHKIKLFKLLYFFDFEHFKETGRSVTGLDYFAWEKGPVPKALNNEILSPSPDITSKVQFIKEASSQKEAKLHIYPCAKFDESCFTRRELRLLEQLATEFRDTLAAEMVEATHLKNHPWDRVYNQEKNVNQRIPYEYVLSEEELEDIKEKIQENKEIRENYL